MFWLRDFMDPASGSGSFSLPLNGPFNQVSFGLESFASSFWNMDHLQRGGDGSAQSSIEIKVEVIF